MGNIAGEAVQLPHIRAARQKHGPVRPRHSALPGTRNTGTVPHATHVLCTTHQLRFHTHDIIRAILPFAGGLIASQLPVADEIRRRAYASYKQIAHRHPKGTPIAWILSQGFCEPSAPQASYHSRHQARRAPSSPRDSMTSPPRHELQRARRRRASRADSPPSKPPGCTPHPKHRLQAPSYHGMATRAPSSPGNLRFMHAHPDASPQLCHAAQNSSMVRRP